MKIFEYLNVFVYIIFIHEDERIHVNIKTNLAVFSFSKFQKTRTEKRNKEIAARSNLGDANI